MRSIKDWCGRLIGAKKNENENLQNRQYVVVVVVFAEQVKECTALISVQHVRHKHVRHQRVQQFFCLFRPMVSLKFGEIFTAVAVIEKTTKQNEDVRHASS